MAGSLDVKLQSSIVQQKVCMHDIFVVSHTGEKNIPALVGYKCIHLPRKDIPGHGGVACLVRTELARHTTVVRRHAEFGILWLQIKIPGQGKPLFLAACYLPPAGSAYYKLSESLSIQRHFDVLNSDASELGNLGRIIICGDMNARVGEKSDVLESAVWEGMEAAGVVVPQAAVQVPPRRTQDGKYFDKALGGPFLDLCSLHGLVILNGRLTGDNDERVGGAFTFYARGRPNARSLIDYFIATPSLVFDNQGQVKPGCHMHVDTQLVDTNLTDHACVSLTIKLEREEYVAKKQGSREEACLRYKYSEGDMPSFVEILTSGAWAAKLDTVGGADMSAADSANIFEGTIRDALEELDIRKGGVIMRPKQTTSNRLGQATNSWYSDECRRLAKAWRHDERVHGSKSHAAVQARTQYRNATRAARRGFEEARARKLEEMWKTDPRAFWKGVKDKSSQCALTDLGAWAEYFGALYQANVGGRDYHSIDEHCKQHGLLYPAVNLEETKNATSLSQPITEHEVTAALEATALHKAPGVDGTPADFMKQACVQRGDVTVNVLVPALTRLYNAVLRDNYPQHWSEGALAPLLKSKGLPSNRDDYRGIAVGTAVSKVYSTILNTRGDAWAEKYRKRAQGQFGFREGRGTVQAIFVLSHTIECYRAKRQPLYCAFVDFKKAYDSIDRALLWKSLMAMGVHGEFLHTLQNMYSKVQMRVRLDGRLSSPFPAEAGVKQGDPLSPLLFGLFIDRVEQYFTQRLGSEVGAHVAGQILRVILYADDLVLMAATPQHLQTMLDCLSEFCDACSMTVNVKKSEIVIFNRTCAPVVVPQWHFKGQNLVVKKEFCYLGIWFREDGLHGGVRGACDRQHKAANAALHAMWRRCYSLRICNVRTLCYLFDALIKPIAGYGCEIWAPSVLLKKGKLVCDGTQEVMHTIFMRQSLGVRGTTPNAIVLRELGRDPLWMFWVKQCCKFWNKTIALPDDDVVKKAMYESVQLAMEPSGVDSWAGRFLQCLCALGVLPHPSQVFEQRDGNMTTRLRPFGMQAVCTAMHKSTVEMWAGVQAAGLPRSMPDEKSVGYKLATYNAWFGVDKFEKSGVFTAHLGCRKDIATVARFRMGSHSLDIEVLRWGKNYTKRSKRICTCCQLGQIEDEQHVMMECTAYADIRLQMLGTNTDMKKVSNGDGSGAHWRAVAKFLKACGSIRACIRSRQISSGIIPSSMQIDM